MERRMDLPEQEMHTIGGLRGDVAKVVEAQEFQPRLTSAERKAPE